MKVSVSLPDDDVEFLDGYALQQGLGSRSAAVHRAIRILRTSELGGTYEAAWAEWLESAEDALWESTSADGTRS